MTHIERITDVPEPMVPTIRQRMEQRGANVVVHDQGGGLFTVEGTYPDTQDAVAAVGATGVLAASPIVAPGPLTDTQARAAKAIVNIFETGEVLGDYGRVTLIPGDTGHLTYGRSQTTLGSGLLHDLLEQYVDNAGARFAARLRPFLARTAGRDLTLDHDDGFHNNLRAAADDPVMRETQDVFFDTAYWRPALKAAKDAGLTLPLAIAVAYDGRVHGSWALLRDQTTAADGSVQALGERAWVAAYIARRRQWLATHTRADLRPTVYRMDAFQRLVDQDRWGLTLPLVVRDREISAMTLAGAPPRVYDGPAPGTRALAVASPLARGLDVRLLQLALSDAGHALKADGIFGQSASEALRQFQQAQGLAASGAADPAQVASLAARVFAA
ncbi:peptidoglycan-binding protein [Roseateles sp.]|uniref:peptidoglycan-binding protein n=1 Tax=Roseateles sp. TaxID=1971397 RepID=UPI0032658118